MLTGVKDLDYAILNELEDKDLVSFCSVNKDANKICLDQTFWLNRILTKFPNVPSKIFIQNTKDRSWSEYYIYDLRKLDIPNRILTEGSKQNRTDWVMIALNRGADVNFQRGEALRNASYYGNPDIVKILLKAGADVHAATDFSLRWASENGHPNVVRILLQNGANINGIYVIYIIKYKLD